MAEPTPQEILEWALINRARLDPRGEAARYGIDLNEGLPAGTISATSKQPLAFSAALFTSADAYSQAMIDRDFFAHVDPQNGSTPQTRGNAAGYSGGVGENISWRGSTGAIDATQMAIAQHQDLFVDTGIAGRGHRTNILNEDYQQVGIGQVLGVFTSQGTNYNASMLTVDFGVPSVQGQFIVGLAYSDNDANTFYSVGEGRQGISISGGASATTGTAGAYSTTIGTGAQTVTFSGGNLASPLSAVATVISGQNALINLVGNNTLETSVSLTAMSGVIKIIGLGNLGLTLTGNAADNVIVSALGNDILNGGNGVDTATFSGNRADYTVTTDAAGVTTVVGPDGTDKLTNIERLQFKDLLVTLTPGVFTGTDGPDTFINNGVLQSASMGLGNDTFIVGVGSNVTGVIDGGAGTDTLSFAGYNKGVRIDFPSGLTWDGQVSLQMVGFENAVGTSSNDVFFGDDRDNVFDPGPGGADTIYGNGGSDTLSYASATRAMRIDLPSGLSWDGSQTDTFYGIRNAVGSRQNDVILGSGLDNIIDGGSGGSDTLSGGGGSDTLTYVSSERSIRIDLPAGLTWDGVATDYISGFQNLTGSRFNDTIFGDGGNNIIDGGAGGADNMTGGSGIDTLSYASSERAIRVDMPSGLTWDGVDSDYISGFENVLGSRFADVFFGDNAANVFDGAQGHDVIATGGGADRILMPTLAQAPSSSDTISDFASGLDKLLFASASYSSSATLTSGAAPVAPNGTAAFLYNVNTGVLSYDTDGSGAASAIEVATLSNRPTITSSDFSFF